LLKARFVAGVVLLSASAMKQVLFAGVVFLGFAFLLGPLADAIHLPFGVTEIISDLGSIF
jgi:hypothetical protein